MRFETELFHPNIYPDGRVCISILHPPGVDRFNEQESADERWRPILGVESILLSVLSMLLDPNLQSPANLDAAKLYKVNNLFEILLLLLNNTNLTLIISGRFGCMEKESAAAYT